VAGAPGPDADFPDVRRAHLARHRGAGGAEAARLARGRRHPLRGHHHQCHVNYIEIRRTTVWSYEFRRIIDGRVPPAEGTRPYEQLPIPTDLAIVHITLLVEVTGPEVSVLL